MGIRQEDPMASLLYSFYVESLHIELDKRMGNKGWEEEEERAQQAQFIDDWAVMVAAKSTE
eukprot:12467511-Prorocentrum_lima.AAC.1